MVANPKLLEFDCPLCGSNLALHVFLRRPSGGEYQTEFFACSGCSVMFKDIDRFSHLVRNTYNHDEKRVDRKITRPLEPKG